ncbi:MAG: hypothetical protein QF921_15860 [Pseudomonadales bacterium]|nr:hypothetical protein [Pseudomonadales bacterium]MDP6471218.1 hypothetical protein [Pseudomonadales bacterium]MDP6825593.1 hypothetical protein [Pseudomonadales bacterium]MDP6972960.1 hypothetical protein [Pseudomonadales bacterium]
MLRLMDVGWLPENGSTWILGLLVLRYFITASLRVPDGMCGLIVVTSSMLTPPLTFMLAAS